MAADPPSIDVRLPRSWPSNVKSLILQAIPLSRLTIIYSRS